LKSTAPFWLTSALVALGALLAHSQSPPGTGNTSLEQSRADLVRLTAADPAAAEAEVAAWLDRLLDGKLPKELQLEVVEAAKSQKTPSIHEKLARYRDVQTAQGGMAPYSELLYGGDAARGRKVFFEKAEASCVKCHSIGGQGGDTGPALSGSGTNWTREGILESILVPDAKITPGYETVRVLLKDRRGYAGIIKHEDETELTLDCPPDGKVTIKKADIETRRKGLSLMPDGMGQVLPQRDLRDLVEFLASLK
jgi:quinoprotein glucose dehydrogenase